PDGHPAASAAIVIAQDGKPVQDLRTNEGGRVELGIGGETGRPYVLRPRTLAFRREFALDGLEHRIELPLGREVSGGVRIAGKAPETPLQLRLAFDTQPFRGSPERSEIARRLGCEEFEELLLKQDTNEDGSFQWLGLPEEWTGTVGVPHLYTLPGAAP